MAEIYDVRIKVVSQQGTCDAGHRVGDEWVMQNDKTPGGICGGAFCTIFTDARVLSFGGVFPWSDDPDRGQIACPDANNPVVFELRRLK